MVLRSWWIVILALAFAAITAGSAQAGFLPSKEAWRGRQFLLRQRWAAAAGAFKKAVDRGHASASELEGLGYAALKAGQFPLAAATYEKLCTRYPRTASFQVNRGLSYAYQERADLAAKAEEAFRQALKINPHDPDALLNLAVLLHRQGRFEEALPRYREAAAASPKKGYVLIGEADLLRDQGDLDGAYFLYQRALQRSTEWPQTLLGMARLLFIRAANSAGDRARGYYVDAISYAREFVRRTSDSNANKRRWRSEINEANHLIQQATAGRDGTLSLEANTGPPQIILLWPPEEQVKRDVILHGDQIGIIGAVWGGGLSQVTVNGIYPDYPSLDPDKASEIRALIQSQSPLTKEVLTDKIAGLLNKSAGLLNKGGAGLLNKGSGAAEDHGHGSTGSSAAGISLFYSGVPLTNRETAIRIAALDTRNQPVLRTFTVRRAAPATKPKRPLLPAVGKTWALFVGVNNYLIPGVPSLLYPASDARRLYDLMCDPYHGGIDPSSRQAFLLPNEDKQPTRSEIEAYLKEIASRVQPTDTVLLFFSGHGCTTKDGNTYLLTSNSEEGNLANTAFDQGSLDRLLEPLRKARHVALFLDACHAAGILGQTSGVRSLAGDPSYDRLLTEGLRGCDLFVSCGKAESSYEDPIGLQAGVFGHYLAEGLAGAADTNDDGTIQLSELASYVETQVRGWCLPPEGTQQKSGQEKQNPQRFPAAWTDDFPLAITPVGAAREALARLGSFLSADEIQRAEEDLKFPGERSILADWLLGLDASLDTPAGVPQPAGNTPSPPITLAAYRHYREILKNRPGSLQGQLYQLLSPEQALLAIQHLPPTEDSAKWTPAEREWHDHAERLTGKKVTVESFADWMDDWLRVNTARISSRE